MIIEEKDVGRRVLCRDGYARVITIWDGEGLGEYPVCASPVRNLSREHWFRADGASCLGMQEYDIVEFID